VRNRRAHVDAASSSKQKADELLDHAHCLPVIAQLLAAFEADDIVSRSRIDRFPVRADSALCCRCKWFGEFSVTAGDR
jgi:hypothetical protein